MTKTEADTSKKSVNFFESSLFIIVPLELYLTIKLYLMATITSITNP